MTAATHPARKQRNATKLDEVATVASGCAALRGAAQADAARVRLWRFEDARVIPHDDVLATEQALEIRVVGTTPVITMRTPGHDIELATGLLLSEGLVQCRADIAEINQPAANAVSMLLRSFTGAKGSLLRRSSLSNSACGVCGKDKLNLEPMHALPPLPAGPVVASDVLLGLPAQLRAAQSVFERTGGLHAAALFNRRGQLQAIREDVGRHNALDKLNGWALQRDRLPLHDHIVLLSGRASFELLQKCIMARVPVVAAISAPSSYAVRLAREFGVTLVAFLRDERFNIYSAPQRIRTTG